MGVKMRSLKCAFEKGFMDKIASLETPEEVQAVFKEEGIEISAEKVHFLGSILNKVAEKDSVKLSEKDLEEIVGGASRNENSKTMAFRHGFTLFKGFRGKIAGKYLTDVGNGKEFKSYAIAGAATSVGIIAMALIGFGIAATIGVQKLIEYGHHRKWWGTIK